MSGAAQTASAAEHHPAGGPPERTLPPHLVRVAARLTDIASLPEITTQIVTMVDDPHATAQDMHEIVKNDPALAAKVLKVVNSAFYGLPSQIGSLDRAIVMLGLSAVKNIALAASLAQMFKVAQITREFDQRDLWRHCIGVGVCARVLAQRMGHRQADEFFVAGLVHDMGLLMVAQLLPEQLAQVAECCLAEPRNHCTAEQKIIGADHQVFGATLAARWKFPPALRCAVAYHHEPLALTAEFRRFVTVVHVADTICGKLRHGYYLTAHTQDVTTGLLQIIGLDPAAIPDVSQNLPEQIDSAEAILAG